MTAALRSIFKSLLHRNQQGFAFFSLGRVSGEAASSMRRLGGYLANGRKPPVRAPFASREKRRRLANRAFEAHALCEKRMPDAPYGIKRGSLSRHLLPGGWLMPRQVDAGSRIRFSAFRGDASNRPFFWSAVSAGDGCPTRYDAPYGNYAWKPPWHLLPGGWPRTRQDRRTLGTESGSAPCRGNISDRPFNRNAVSAKSGCPVRYTEIKRGSLSLHLLPGGWPRTRQADGGNRIRRSAFRGDASNRRSFGVLFMRKADVRCAIRKSSVEAYLGVSFPAAGQYPDRRALGTESGSAPFAATPPTARSFGVLFMRKADVRCVIRNHTQKTL